MSFRDQLKARREACGLTRAALAEQLGVSASAVGNYETGVSFPKDERISLDLLFYPVPTGLPHRSHCVPININPMDTGLFCTILLYLLFWKVRFALQSVARSRSESFRLPVLTICIIRN